MSRITLDDFLTSPHLGGASEAFRDLEPWRPWLAFARALNGEPLTDAEHDLFQRCTSRTYDPPEGGWHEVACAVGRQAGKTRLASAVVAYTAAMHPPVRDGHLHALLVAQDARAAQRTAFSYVNSIFDASPALSAMVVNRTADTLELENGIRIAVYPCRPAAVRGLRAIVAVCDELAYFRSTEMLPVDREMLRAVRPTLATTGGRLIVLSSPYGQSGALWDLHRKHYGRDDAMTLVWQASAPTMHPTLPVDYLARMEQDDPAEVARPPVERGGSGLSAWEGLGTDRDPRDSRQPDLPGRAGLESFLLGQGPRDGKTSPLRAPGVGVGPAAR